MGKGYKQVPLIWINTTAQLQELKTALATQATPTPHPISQTSQLKNRTKKKFETSRILSPTSNAKRQKWYHLL
jgi:hypothetical protein